jgi:hypothetical protein
MPKRYYKSMLLTVISKMTRAVVVVRKRGLGRTRMRTTHTSCHEAFVGCSSKNEHRQHHRRQQQPKQQMLQTHPHHSYHEQQQYHHQHRHRHYYPHPPQPHQPQDLYHDEDPRQHQMYRPWQNMYYQSQQIREGQEGANLMQSLRNSDTHAGTRNDKHPFGCSNPIIILPAHLIQKSSPRTSTLIQQWVQTSPPFLQYQKMSNQVLLFLQILFFEILVH